MQRRHRHFKAALGALSSEVHAQQVIQHASQTIQAIHNLQQGTTFFSELPLAIRGDYEVSLPAVKKNSDAIKLVSEGLPQSQDFRHDVPLETITLVGPTVTLFETPCSAIYERKNGNR